MSRRRSPWLDAAAAAVGDAGADACRLQAAAVTKRYAATANLDLCFILKPLPKGKNVTERRICSKMIYNTKA